MDPTRATNPVTVAPSNVEQLRAWDGDEGAYWAEHAEYFDRSVAPFHERLLAVTRDPAMLLWLNGSENTKWAPNENYARELMELFTLGAGRGYTELDVRQQARALGF